MKSMHKRLVKKKTNRILRLLIGLFILAIMLIPSATSALSGKLTQGGRFGTLPPFVLSDELPQINVPTSGYGSGLIEFEEDGAGTLVFSVSDDITPAGDINVTFSGSDNSTLVSGSGVSIHNNGGEVTLSVRSNSDQNGSATINLTATDSDGNSAQKSIQIVVEPVNDAPVANDQTININEDSLPYLISKSSISEDADVITNSDSYTLTINSGAQHGTVDVEARGNIKYTATPNFNGIDSFTYTATDLAGASDTGTITVNVSQVNDIPVAQNDTATTKEDIPIDIYVLANDTDIDQDSSFNADPGSEVLTICINESGLNAPAHGTIATDGTKITYTPAENYFGTDAFDYYCFDGDAKVKASVLVTIESVNDAPIINIDPEDYLEIDEGQSSATLILYNFAYDPEREKLNFGEDMSATYGTLERVLINGFYSRIKYRPMLNFNGYDTIRFNVYDSEGLTTWGTMNILIWDVNDAPVAQNDIAATNEDTAVEIYPLMNDSDIDTDPTLNMVLNMHGDLDVLSVMIGESGLAIPAHGSITTDGTKITYIPDADYNGSDAFEYYCYDGEEMVKGSIAVTIEQVNDNPTAVNDSVATLEDTSIRINVLENDIDVDTITSINEGELHYASDFFIDDCYLVGTLSGTVRKDGQHLVFEPGQNFNGTQEIEYVLDDGRGGSSIGTLTVSVEPENDAPEITNVNVARHDSKARIGSNSVKVSWTAFDPDNDILTYTIEYFDGSEWLMIDKGISNAEMIYTIPVTITRTSDLLFRISAFDGVLSSEWRNSNPYSAYLAGARVLMSTVDGQEYTPGTWTKRDVIISGSGAKDISQITYYYVLDSNPAQTGASMTVTEGVHKVHVTAQDEFENEAVLGEFQILIDKNAPVTPTIVERATKANVVIDITLHDDPGGSGNSKLTMPNGTVVNARGALSYSVTRNGKYDFTLSDAAGNRRTFSYEVAKADKTVPKIEIATGAYKIGTSTSEPIKITLIYTDDESNIVARGYQISSSSATNGVFRTYAGSIKLSEPGSYYIHAFSQNAFGLDALITFGPFKIDAAATTQNVSPTPMIAANGADTPQSDNTPSISATPIPQVESGNVVVTSEYLNGISGDVVKIRLPGQEWGTSLTLDNVTPGKYLIEAIDANGNMRTIVVNVTLRDIESRSLRSSQTPITSTIIIIVVTIALGGISVLLLIRRRIVVTIFSNALLKGKGKRISSKVSYKKGELTIFPDPGKLKNGDLLQIVLSKYLTKKMHSSWVVIAVNGRVVFKEQVKADIGTRYHCEVEFED